VCVLFLASTILATTAQPVQSGPLTRILLSLFKSSAGPASRSGPRAAEGLFLTGKETLEIGIPDSAYRTFDGVAGPDKAYTDFDEAIKRLDDQSPPPGAGNGFSWTLTVQIGI
jgi:hypothetical protein